MDEKQISVTLERLSNFEFKVSFDACGQEFLMDEPEPIGGGHGPNAVRVLSAAIGNCLTASLLFCLQKARANAGGLKTTVTSTIVRNESGRFRVGRSDVTIEADLQDEDLNKVGRCLGLFEDFCIVTAAVRQGIDVGVKVRNRSAGEIIYDSADHER